MTSRDFYRQIDQVLRSQLEDQGFTRVKSTCSVWGKPLDERFILLRIFKGVKEPYLKPIGGKFNVSLYLVNSLSVHEATAETCVSFLRSFSDSDLLEMKRIRQQVLRKILSQTNFESEFDKTMFELHRPMMEFGFEHNFIRNQPWSLEYLDGNDVLTWAEFIASKVPQSVDGIAGTIK
jgi:hypothetical protein